MTCNDALGVLDAYLDGELSVEDRWQAHEHFARCESCRRVAKAEAALHTLVAQAVTDEEVPAGLRERILAGVEAAASRAGERPQRRRLRPGRLWLAASALVVAMLGGLLVGWIARDRTTPLTAELASKHVLYAEARGSMLQLLTSDPARIRGWLEHHLGFSVRLPSLARRPESLVGGRISSVADTPAAYVLYDRSGHLISLFVTRRVRFARRGWTEQRVDGTELYFASLDGVALVWWADEGADRVYAAASAVGADKLVDFALACIRSSPPVPG